MRIDQCYKALSDESRLRLLFALSRGQFNVGELTNIVGLSQPTVSHHLKILERAELARARKNGTSTYYSLNRSEESPVNLLLPEQFLNPSSHTVIAQDKALLEVVKQDAEAISTILNERRDQSLSFFEGVAADWEDLNQDNTLREVGIHNLLERIPSDGVLIELGCGGGNFLERVLPRKAETIAVDQSQAMLGRARIKLGKKAEQVDLRLGRLEHLPVGDDSVDCAVTNMVFHHLPNPQEALLDVQRVLKPGGQFLICDLVRHENEDMRNRYGDLWLGFELEEFQDWMREAGFSLSESLVFGDHGEAFVMVGTSNR